MKLSSAQRKNAAIIIKTGRSMGASRSVLKWALRAAWVESRLTNVKYGDADSLGVFQQRPSMGWGTPAQVTNVKYAATQFFKRAIPLDKSGYSGNLAQAVQRSAFPGRYVAADAVSIADSLLSGKLPSIGGGFTTPGGLDYKPGTEDTVVALEPLRQIRNLTGTSSPTAGPTQPKNRPGGLGIAYEAPNTRVEEGKPGELVDTPGVRMPGAGTGLGPGGSLKIGGGGAKKVTTSLTRGLGPITSSTRNYDTVAGPATSDHYRGAPHAYAVDIGATGRAGNRIVKTLSKRLGVSPSRLTGTFSPIVKNGFRIQVLWQVEDHYDHVHVGVRRV